MGITLDSDIIPLLSGSNPSLLRHACISGICMTCRSSYRYSTISGTPFTDSGCHLHAFIFNMGCIFLFILYTFNDKVGSCPHGNFVSINIASTKNRIFPTFHSQILSGSYLTGGMYQGFFSFVALAFAGIGVEAIPRWSKIHTGLTAPAAFIRVTDASIFSRLKGNISSGFHRNGISNRLRPLHGNIFLSNDLNVVICQ